MTDAAKRREELISLYNEARGCVLCPLSRSRTQVVFGAGNSDADLMFVGEAPGAEEDRRGLPFVGRAGRLLDELLAENGLARNDVFITNVLKCLRYTAKVQLADGSWERIGRLVRSRYSGEVMSVTPDGTLVPRRVVGWHATPVAGRRVFRLSYRTAKRAGARTVSIELTGDHAVLTKRGYVPAEDLTERDVVATGHGLSPLAWETVVGTLLGDGTLCKASSYLAFTHTEEQAEYARFKADLLAELRPQEAEAHVAATVGGPHQHRVLQVRTLAHRSLRTLRREFYKPRKVVPSWLGDCMTPLMLAIWFMDDGHMRVRPPRKPSADISSDCFDDASLTVLLRGLAGLGIEGHVRAHGRIAFDVEQTVKLSEVIAPYVPYWMRYKLHPEAALRVPYQPALLRAYDREPRVMFDQVRIADVTDRPRPDTTFFCIDVDETHNFVTAGGVVHNCRPPGNRDPQPEEIATCRPYLDKQIGLIEPRVVCTLGNFATKLLTDRQTGITRVHGVPQQHAIGGRAVTIYPLFHPAAALRTPSVKDELRADFARLPRLLESSDERKSTSGPVDETPPDEQLGLFS